MCLCFKGNRVMKSVFCKATEWVIPLTYMAPQKAVESRLKVLHYAGGALGVCTKQAFVDSEYVRL